MCGIVARVARTSRAGFHEKKVALMFLVEGLFAGGESASGLNAPLDARKAVGGVRRVARFSFRKKTKTHRLC